MDLLGGSEVAMKNVFEYLLRLGHDEDFQPQVDPRFEPTDAPMGSKEKIEVLARRAQLGLPLWHPKDRSACSLPDDVCIRMLKNKIQEQPQEKWRRKKAVK